MFITKFMPFMKHKLSLPHSQQPVVGPIRNLRHPAHIFAIYFLTYILILSFPLRLGPQMVRSLQVLQLQIYMHF
jgi:hypothetical protein